MRGTPRAPGVPRAEGKRFMHDRLLAGFERFDVAVDGVRIAGRSAGSGPPVLLLPGYPQRSHRSWLSAAPSCWLGVPVSL
jgi:hypothetical protein